MHRVEQPNSQGCSDAPESRHVRRVTTEKHINQCHQRQSRRPSSFQHCQQPGDLLGRQTFQAQSLSLEVHDRQHTQIVHSCGHNCRDHNSRIRHLEEFRHHERRGTHDRWRNLPTCAGGSFDPAGKVPGVPHTFHIRNGQRPGRHRVGNRRP